MSNINSTMQAFAKLLEENGIVYSVHEPNLLELTYRDHEFLSAYFNVETTQVFSNSNCMATYLQEDWRANPFAAGGLGNIDISIEESFTNLFVSAKLPCEPIENEQYRQQIHQHIESLIAQGEGSFQRGISCKWFQDVPYIILGFASIKPSMDMLFSAIQLFALEVHRIFGSLLRS